MINVRDAITDVMSKMLNVTNEMIDVTDVAADVAGEIAVVTDDETAPNDLYMKICK
jgi:hypothetical protein